MRLNADLQEAISFLCQTATRILQGKARSWKILVFAVFMISVGTLIEIAYQPTLGATIFMLLGIGAFITGLNLYKKEVESELTKTSKGES